MIKDALAEIKKMFANMDLYRRIITRRTLQKIDKVYCKSKLFLLFVLFYF